LIRMMEMIKFPVPTRPLDDESLMGFIARACDRNGHPHIRNALKLAGINVHHASFVGRDTKSDVHRLSHFFGCSEMEWRSRIHAKIEGMRGFSNFFGIPLRQYFREPKIRRVSPAALRRSAHHRAVWQIKPFHYCPTTGELLISRCPNPACERSLTWNATYGIQYCEFCVGTDAEPVTDLRSLHPTKLDGEDLQIYSAVANLVDPMVEDAAVVNPALPSWPRWELFDLVVLLAVILSKRLPDRAKLKKVDMFGLRDWHPNFMLACRAVLGWPSAFQDVIEVMREGREQRDGYWGLKKEIGDLAFNLQTRFGATARMNAEIERQIDLFFAERGRTGRRSYAEMEGSNKEWISFKGALKAYGSSQFLHSLIENREAGVLRVDNAKRAPVYFSKPELEALMEARKALICLDRLYQRTGFTDSVIQGLVRSGHVIIATGPAARLRMPSVEPGEIRRIERRLTENASHPAAGQIPLLSAVRDKGAGEHLLEIVRGCLDSNFRYSMASRDGNIMSRIMVLPADIRTPGMQLESAIVFPDKMTAGDIEIVLDIPEGDIGRLVDAGILKRALPPRKRYLDGITVQRLANKFISHRSLANRLSLNVRTLKRHMESLGVRPAIVYKSANGTPGFLWKRSKVAAAFEDALPWEASAT